MEKFIFEEIKGTKPRKASSVLKAFTLIPSHTHVDTHTNTHSYTFTLYIHTYIAHIEHTHKYIQTHKHTHTYTNIYTLRERHTHTYAWLTSPDFLLDFLTPEGMESRPSPGVDYLHP